MIADALTPLRLLSRIVRRLARQPSALWHFTRVFVECALRNPRALEYVGAMAALYIHFGPFSRFVIASLDEQIRCIDAGEWRSPIGDHAISAGPAADERHGRRLVLA